jgi:hypothetical protein
MGSSEVLTHLLHLASSGHIKHHVDNIEASGQTLLGACLGSSRVIELVHEKEGVGFRALLEPGTVCASFAFAKSSLTLQQTCKRARCGTTLGMLFLPRQSLVARKWAGRRG